MQHNIRLSVQEKIKIWLDLCDFSYKLMEQNLSKKELHERLKKLREEHLRNDVQMLKKIFKYDTKKY